MPLNDFYNKIRVIEDFDLQTEAIKIIQDNSYIIEELLREQLAKGIDGKNQPVTIYGSTIYKDSTSWYKTFHGVGLGKETGWITNYMTGAFYKSLFTETSGDEFFIKSNIGYYSKIISRSGEDIMRLTPENLRWFSETILIPQIREIFSTRFNGV